MILVTFIYIKVNKYNQLLQLITLPLPLEYVLVILLFLSPIIIPMFIIMFIFNCFKNYIIKFKVAYNEETKKELFKTDKRKD